MPKLSIRRRASAIGPNVGARDTGGATCVGTLVGRSEPKGSDASVITAVLGWSGMVRQTLGLQSIAWLCRCHLARAVPPPGFRSGGPQAYLRSPGMGKIRADLRRLHEPV